MQMLERKIASLEHRLVLLAPPDADIPPAFDNVVVDAAQARRVLREVQRVRGTVYSAEGAVSRAQLAEDGAHCTPEDDRSWHMVVLNDEGSVSACIWYLRHHRDATFDDLRLRRSALATHDVWGHQLRQAITSEMTRARHEDIGFAESGGWAVAKECRCTTQGLAMALSAYALGQVFGGTLALATATVRNASSTILRRIGGGQLGAHDAPIPAYFDPSYGCDIELLRFDSRQPNRRYLTLVELLERQLAQATVLASSHAAAFAATPAAFARMPVPQTAHNQRAA